MGRGSTILPHHRHNIITRYPYHKLDQIQEDDHSSELLASPAFHQEEEEEQIHSNNTTTTTTNNSFSINPAAAAAARVQALRSKMQSMRRNSMRSSSYSARRRNRWRRVRLRICRVRLISWLSPMEFLKKLRNAYIQALSSKESQCGLVMMGSPWSFPVVVPFRGI